MGAPEVRKWTYEVAKAAEWRPYGKPWKELKVENEARSDWTVSMRLDKTDVAVLRYVLVDPSPGVDPESVDRLLSRLDKIWDQRRGKGSSGA